MERPSRHPLRLVTGRVSPKRSSSMIGYQGPSKKDEHLLSRLLDLAVSITREDVDVPDDEIIADNKHEENARKCLAFLSKQKDRHELGRSDNDVIDNAMRSLIVKHSIALRPVVSEAIAKTYKSLKEAVRVSEASVRASRQRAVDRGAMTYFEEPALNSDNLGSAIRLILSLAGPPDVQTEVFASLQTESPRARLYLTATEKQDAERSEWKRILAEEGDDASYKDYEDEDGMESEDWSDIESNISSSEQEESDREDIRLVFKEDLEDRETRGQRLRKARDDTYEKNKSRIAEESLEQHQTKLGAIDHAEAAGYWEEDLPGRPLGASGSYDMTYEGESIESVRHHANEELRKEKPGRFLFEVEVMREVLRTLEARTGKEGSHSVLFECQDATWSLRTDAAQLPHLSPASYASLLAMTADMATSLSLLWGYVDAMTKESMSRTAVPPTAQLCVEAMASEIESLLVTFAQRRANWDCTLAAAMRTSIGSNSSSTMTTVHLESLLRSDFATLSMLESVVRETGGLDETRRLPSVASLLDTLHRALTFSLLLQDKAEGKSSDFAHQPNTSDLARCFLITARPAWNDVQTWLTRGAFTVVKEKERSEAAYRHFFAKSSATNGILEAEHWNKGIEEIQDSFPNFLQPLALDIMMTGKTVGLLRAMGFDGFLRSISWTEENDKWTLEAIMRASLEGGITDEDLDDEGSASLPSDAGTNAQEEGNLFVTQRHFNAVPDPRPTDELVHEALFSHGRCSPKVKTATTQGNTDTHDEIVRCLDGITFPSILATQLSPIFSLARKRLHDVLFAPRGEGGCDLMQHLDTLQGLYLMRRGADMGAWCEAIFERLDRGLAISDFHILNSAFREETSAHSWLDTGLVRFRWAGAASETPSEIRDLRCILIDYSVPWPLNYLFTPAALGVYQSIFTLLLQLARSKAVLDRTGRARPGVFLVRARQRDGTSLQEGHSQIGNGRSTAARPPLAQPMSALQPTENAETRLFYAVRRRFTWVICIFGEYVGRDVIETESQRLHLRFREGMISFEVLIESHSSSLDRIAWLCFLSDARGDDEATTLVRKALLDIMDMVLMLAGAFAAYTGDIDAEHNLRVEERERKQRRRRRKERRRSKGEKSYRKAGTADDEDDEEEEEEEEEEEKEEIMGEVQREEGLTAGGVTTMSTTFSTFFDEDDHDSNESLLGFVRRLDTKLDVALNLIRKQLGVLAARASGEARHDDREALQNLLLALEG